MWQKKGRIVTTTFDLLVKVRRQSLRALLWKLWFLSCPSVVDIHGVVKVLKRFVLFTRSILKKNGMVTWRIFGYIWMDTIFDQAKNLGIFGKNSWRHVNHNLHSQVVFSTTICDTFLLSSSCLLLLLLLPFKKCTVFHGFRRISKPEAQMPLLLLLQALHHYYYRIFSHWMSLLFTTKSINHQIGNSFMMGKF